MAGKNSFGFSAGVSENRYEADFDGPLHVLKSDGGKIEFLATHQDDNALLGTCP